MPRLSRSTVALFLGASLLNALYGWLSVAEQVGYSPPPLVSRLLLREPLERQATVRARRRRRRHASRRRV